MRSPDQIGITWEENQSLMMQLKEKQALENRRKNNIFEVGDKIIFDVMGNSVMEYADCLNMFLSQSLIRHATDAEIEAGKRLEVS